jgi:hypothetical protein
MTFFSFRKLNPDWDIILYSNPMAAKPSWTTTEQEDSTPVKDYWSELDDLTITKKKVPDDLLAFPLTELSNTHTSDLLSWKLLGTVGGVVADSDILFVRPLKDLILSMGNAEVGLHCFTQQTKGYIPVSFMMSSGSEFFLKVYQAAVDNYDPTVYESAGTPALISCWSSPNKFPSTYRYYWLPDEAVFPFVPLARFWGEGIRKLVLDTVDIDKELHNIGRDPTNFVGIHWYGNNPTVKRTVKSWTSKSFSACTLSRCMEQLL